MSNTFPKEKIFQSKKVRLYRPDRIIHKVYLAHITLNSFGICCMYSL